MSYCRFSDQNFTSEMYVYANNFGGITICVAGRKLVGEPPRVPPLPLERKSVDEWFEAYKKQNEWLANAEYLDITLPYCQIKSELLQIIVQ